MKQRPRSFDRVTRSAARLSADRRVPERAVLVGLAALFLPLFAGGWLAGF